MSDFSYDSKDTSAIRSVATSIYNHQNTVFNISAVVFGILSGRQLYQSVIKKQTFSCFKLGSNFLGASSVYFVMMFMLSRWRHNEAAAKINRKYSSIISKTLDYSDNMQ